MKTKLKLGKWEDFAAEQLKNPAVKKAYDDLELEYKLRELILEARIKKGITQKQLAKKMKTTQSVLSRFESGRANPTLDFIQRLADALKVKIKMVVV